MYPEVTVGEYGEIFLGLQKNRPLYALENLGRARLTRAPIGAYALSPKGVRPKWRTPFFEGAYALSLRGVRPFSEGRTPFLQGAYALSPRGLRHSQMSNMRLRKGVYAFMPRAIQHFVNRRMTSS